MRDLEQIERRGRTAGGRVDKYIEIAVRTCIAARTRTEEGKLSHAFSFNRRRDLAQLGDNYFECDVCNVIHGCMLAHLRETRSYSAASLWPSLALSLWISSSAASAITVPGGKIASAPALYSAS